MTGWGWIEPGYPAHILTGEAFGIGWRAAFCGASLKPSEVYAALPVGATICPRCIRESEGAKP